MHASRIGRKLSISVEMPGRLLGAAPTVGDTAMPRSAMRSISRWIRLASAVDPKRAVLDAVHSRFDRVGNARWTVRVGGHHASESMGLFHGRAQLRHRVLRQARVGARRHVAAGGHDLDHVHAGFDTRAGLRAAPPARRRLRRP